MDTLEVGGGLLDEQHVPPDAVEALEELAPYNLLLHRAFQVALAHASAYSKQEGSTNPWLYADLVRNKALGYLMEHAAEHGIRVEQLSNAGIRLTVQHRSFGVRKAGHEERESGQYEAYTQLTLPGFAQMGFVRKPHLVLLWVVDAQRHFAGFELARPLANGKLVWKVPVPQPMSPAVRGDARAKADSIQSLEEARPCVPGAAAAEEESTAPQVAQTLWSTLPVTGKHAHESG